MERALIPDVVVKANEFLAATPLIPGAVMNRIGGTLDDQADMKPASYRTCEYWTPMACSTMWLMAEIQAQPK